MGLQRDEIRAPRVSLVCFLHLTSHHEESSLAVCFVQPDSAGLQHFITPLLCEKQAAQLLNPQKLLGEWGCNCTIRFYQQGTPANSVKRSHRNHIQSTTDTPGTGTALLAGIPFVCWRLCSSGDKLSCQQNWVHSKGTGYLRAAAIIKRQQSPSVI